MSRRFAATSAFSLGCFPSSDLAGTDSLRSSTTRGPCDAERLAGLVVRPHPAVVADRGADDGHRLVLQRAVAERPRQPVDRVLQHAGNAAVVLRGDDERGVGVGGGLTQRHHRLGHVVVVDVLVVERQLAQPVEQLSGVTPSGAVSDGQLGQLTVDRRGAQASHQHQDLDVRHVTLPFGRLDDPRTA